jgi:uncharacterized protein YyaL (SSP411 family)
VVIEGKKDSEEVRAMLAAINSVLVMNKVVVLADGNTQDNFLAKKLDILRNFKPAETGCLAHVCHDFVCETPTSDPQQVIQQLTSS